MNNSIELQVKQFLVNTVVQGSIFTESRESQTEKKKTIVKRLKRKVEY